MAPRSVQHAFILSTAINFHRLWLNVRNVLADIEMHGSASNSIATLHELAATILVMQQEGLAALRSIYPNCDGCLGLEKK